MRLANFISAVLCLLLWALSVGESQATHIVGGEISYTDLGSGLYQIRLTVYRDCGPANVNGTGFDDYAKVGIFDDNGLYELMEVPLSSTNVSMVPVVMTNPCGTPPPDVCVEQAVYIANAFLPATPQGYTLSYQRCCRNPSIVNIVAPEDAGATFTTQIPGTDITNDANSSPVFNSLPPVALCADFEFMFDHGATDADGDELVYTMCTPLHGASPDNPAPNPVPPPYTTVNWAAGFSATNPITADPDFAIDPVTGMMTGTPTAAGQYIIGVCVEEWRDGVLLSTSNRDFQFNVTICDPNIISAVANQAADQLCIGESMTFTNFSINGTFFLWDFGVPGTDADTSNLESPTFTFPAPGSYTVTLIANPGWPCADISSEVYEVFSPPVPEVQIDNYDCAAAGEEFYTFSTVAPYPEADLIWDFGSQANPQFSNLDAPSGILFTDGIVQASVSVTENGCGGEGTFDFVDPGPPTALILPQDEFCAGFTFDFVQEADNATGYLWDFGLPGDQDISYDAFPTFTFPDTGHFEVTLIAEGTYHCPDTATQVFEVYWLLNPWFNPPDPDCFLTHNFNLSVEGVVDPQATYSWDFGGAASGNSNGGSVSNLVYDEPGVYTVELTVSGNGCEVNYDEQVEVILDPTVSFEAGPPSGCPPHPVSYQNQSATTTVTNYTWHFGDGTTSTFPTPTHVYLAPGQYTVTLEMSTGGYCAQELALTQTNIITVHPSPQAGFDVEPNAVDILEPQVEVVDESEGANQVYYSFGDGGSSTDPNLLYEYSAGGLFWITQTVVNAYGCTDVAQGQVAVNGSLFYAPNTFTPNNDGINDVWLPLVTGSTSYRLEIFDRWGVKIFETFNAEAPWLGNVLNGEHFAPDGMYSYRVWMEDQIKMPSEYAGTILLFR